MVDLIERENMIYLIKIENNVEINIYVYYIFWWENNNNNININDYKCLKLCAFK